MRPSKRIDQIYTERFGRDPLKLVLAIEVYLDEEWKKNKQSRAINPEFDKNEEDWYMAQAKH